MSCTSSSTALSSLSKHFAATTLDFSPSPAAAKPPSSPAFRSALSTRIAQEDADRQLLAFARGQQPSNQIEARPPSPLRLSDEELAEPSAALSSSPYWSPEQERLHYLSSSSSSSSASSFSLSYKRRAEVPDEDEAASISSTPPTSAGTSFNSLRSGEGKCELTMDPSLHSAWDFEKLFSRRRRWFGGVRIPGEDFTVLEPPEENRGRSTVAQVMLGRADAHDRQLSRERRVTNRRSLSGSRLRDCPSIAGPEEALERVKEEENPAEELAKRERQKEVFEQLRKVAMMRLEAVGKQLDWGKGVP